MVHPVTKERARPLIQRALDRGLPLYSADDILALCDDGKMQLWAVGESVLVTEIVDFPQARAVRAVVAAGRLSDIKTVLPDAEAWAKEKGAKYALAGGRKGWERALGYRPEAAHLVKEL